MILQDHKAYSTVVEFDPTTKHLARRSRCPDDLQNISGWAGEIGGRQVLFYKHNGRLFLHLNGKEISISELSLALVESERRRRLTIRHDGKTTFDLEYDRPSIWPPMNDVLSPGEDDESFDFGLFLYNIITKPERRGVALEVWR